MSPAPTQDTARLVRSPGQRLTQSAAGPRLRLLVGLLVYAAMLHWTYRVKISPAFTYMGLRYREPDILYYALALALMCGIALLMPTRLRWPSDFVVWVLFVMAAVPSILVPQYGDIITKERSFELAVYVALSFALIVALAPRGPKQMIPRLVVPPALVWVTLTLISLCTYGYLLYTSGLSFRFVALEDVREIRFEYRDQIAATGRTLAYLVRLQGNVINPIILARGIYRRRWTLVGVGTVGQLLIFSATGFKMMILSSVALVALAGLFRVRRRPAGTAILVGIFASATIALSVDAIRGTLLYTELFVDRMLLTPGVLTAAHVMVFEGIPKAHWGYSFMAPFVDYPYSTTPAFMVGGIFAGNSSNSANANFFADGYANLGYPGMLIEAAVVVGILWLVNSSARHLPLAVSSLILLLPTFALVNSSAFTGFLTDGYLAAVVMMACLPPNGWSLRPRKTTAHPVPQPPLRLR